MAAEDWYYQVWVHRGVETQVRVVGTYKAEWRAMQIAEAYNTAEEHHLQSESRAAASDNRRPASDCVPQSFYFVRPIFEEDLSEDVQEMFRSHLQEDKELFMAHYRGELRPYAQRMVASVLRSIETMESARSFILDNEGGWHEGYDEDYDGVHHIVCYAIYSGVERIRLEVAFARGADWNSALVGIFRDEKDLIDWLCSSGLAVKACEEKLIEIFCDRHLPNNFSWW